VKKTFALIAAVLFVLSFAASAFAIHAEIPAETQAIVAKGGTQITLGGEIRVRGWYFNNFGDVYGAYWDSYNHHWDGGPTLLGQKFGTETNDKAWYDQRVRLYVDAQVTPNVRGYVMLETQAGTGNTQWDSTSDKYRWGNFNSHPSGIAIAEAWILYNGSGLFGFNSGLKIGHMPLKLGEGQFFDHTQLGDDAIVFFMDPTKELHIGLLTVKFAGDGNSGSTAYSPVLPFGQGSFLNSVPGNAGGWGGFAGWSSGAGNHLNNQDDLDGYVALMTYKIDAKNTVGINYTYLNKSDIGFSLQDLGLHANGSIDNFGYKAEVDFQFGKLFNGISGLHSLDYKGWAVMLAGNYKFTPEFNLRGSFAYGSGDDELDDHDINTFIPFVGSVQNYTLIYEYLATTTAGGTGTGIANTTYYNLGMDYAATKELSFGLDGYILRATKAWDSGISKSAGWEIDAKMKYQIAKNLTYQIDAGYFKPGQFYKDTLNRLTEVFVSQDWDGDSRKKTSETEKGITVIRNMLTLSF